MGGPAAVESGLDEGPTAIVGVGHPAHQAPIHEALQRFGGPPGGLDHPPGQVSGRHRTVVGERHSGQGAIVRGGEAGVGQGLGQPDVQLASGHVGPHQDPCRVWSVVTGQAPDGGVDLTGMVRGVGHNSSVP